MQGIFFAISEISVLKKKSNKNFLYGILIILIINCLFFLGSSYFGLGRPYINFDYFLVLFFYALGLRFIAIILCSVFLLFEFFALIGQVFPFVRFSDFIYLSKFTFDAPFPYIMVMGFSLLLFPVIIYLFYLSSELLGKIKVFVIFNIVVFSFAVMRQLIPDYYDGDKYWKVAKGKLISSVTEYVLTYRFVGFAEGFNTESNSASEYEGIAAIDFLSETIDQYENILFVINESWGVPVNDLVQKEIVSIDSFKDFEVEVHEINFSGYTVQGEMRELCRKSVANINLKILDDNDFSGCLPSNLKLKGYKTYAIHGATGNMYDRAYWYPKVGFDKAIFYENMSLDRRCYSFPGACDSDIFSVIESLHRSDEKKFIYWLTLNTHASYDMRDLDKDLFDCEIFKISGHEFCRNLKLQKQFFHNLSVYLKDKKDILVVVVGDHEPRIVDKSTVHEDFKLGKVPVLILKR